MNLEPDGYKPPALPLRYVPVWCRPRESNPLESPWITDLQSVSPPERITAACWSFPRDSDPQSAAYKAAALPFGQRSNLEYSFVRESIQRTPGVAGWACGTRTKTRTPISGLEDRCTVRLCYASILVVPAGIEPAKPASLAPYICQFCYGTMLVSCVGFEPGALRV